MNPEWQRGVENTKWKTTEKSPSTSAAKCYWFSIKNLTLHLPTSNFLKKLKMSHCKPFSLRFSGRLGSGLLVTCCPSSFLRSFHFSAFSFMALLVYRCREEVPSQSPFLGLALLSRGRENGRPSAGGGCLSLSSSPLSSGSRSCPLSFCSWLFVSSDSDSGGRGFFGSPWFSPEAAGLVPALCSLSPLSSSDKALSDCKKKNTNQNSQFQHWHASSHSSEFMVLNTTFCGWPASASSWSSHAGTCTQPAGETHATPSGSNWLPSSASSRWSSSRTAGVKEKSSNLSQNQPLAEFAEPGFAQGCFVSCH